LAVEHDRHPVLAGDEGGQAQPDARAVAAQVELKAKLENSLHISVSSAETRQGLTLVHFSAQPEPFLPQKQPLKPAEHPLNNHQTHPLSHEQR
jgi:hypothetical protein